jgi:peptide/nickel transport system substrate-binding protein
MAPTGLATSLDPFSYAGGTAQSGPEQLALFGSLLRFDTPTNTFKGELAESITPNADASQWTLKLRSGVKFGNGDAMDATAVKASIERDIDPKSTSSMKREGAYIQSIQIVDPLTLKFTLTQPYGFWPLTLSAGGGQVGALGMIQDVKVVNQMGADKFGQNPSLGAAGPYELDSWNPPNQVVLKARSNWWGGPVCIKKLTFVQLDSIQARLDGLKNGDVHVSTLSRDPVDTAAALATYPHVTTIDQGNAIVEFNQANKQFADLRTRQAVAYAIDPKVVSARAFGGKALASSGLVYADKSLGIAKGTEGLPYDPEKAKSLVQQLKAEGNNLTFTLLCANSPSNNVQAAVAIKSLLEAVGFKVTVKPLGETELITDVYANRNFDFWLGGQVGPLASEYSSLYRFASKNPANAFGVKDPAFDAALDTLSKAQTTDQLLSAMNAVQQEWNKVLPGVVYASDEPALIWNAKVHGMYFTRGITPYFDKAYVTS